jgi:glucose/arabinose dehydrogenase
MDRATRFVYMHEHGPKGGDEVNLVSAGANYGWPVTSFGVNYTGAKISPFRTLEGITETMTQWTPSIAPSGLAFYSGDAFPDWQGDLFVGALVDKDVKRLDLKGGKVVSEESLFAEIGQRIRDVREGPNGALFILSEQPGEAGGKLTKVVPR